MPIDTENGKPRSQTTLHLHGKEFKNMESQPEPSDLKADLRAQLKFEGENFYGTAVGLAKMLKAEKETIKLNRLTADDRIDPKINHDRMKSDT